MGAALGPAVAAVVTSVLVSKVASGVAEKLGLGEDHAGLVGLGAGIVAGGAMYEGAVAGEAAASARGTAAIDGHFAANQAAPVGAKTTGTGLDLSSGMDAGLSVGGNPANDGLSLASSNTPGVANTVGGPTSVPSIGGGDIVTSSAPPVQAQSGGLLSEGIGAGNTSTAIGKNNIVEKVGAKDSWWKKLFSPENTTQLAIAGIGGYGKAGMAKEAMEYDEDVKKDNEKDWVAADPNPSGFNSVNVSYPSQQRG